MDKIKLNLNFNIIESNLGLSFVCSSEHISNKLIKVFGNEIKSINRFSVDFILKSINNLKIVFNQSNDNYLLKVCSSIDVIYMKKGSFGSDNRINTSSRVRPKLVSTSILNSNFLQNKPKIRSKLKIEIMDTF